MLVVTVIKSCRNPKAKRQDYQIIILRVRKLPKPAKDKSVCRQLQLQTQLLLHEHFQGQCFQQTQQGIVENPCH